MSTGHRVVFRSYIRKRQTTEKRTKHCMKNFTGKEIQLTKIHGDMFNLRNIWEMQIKILFTY